MSMLGRAWPAMLLAVAVHGGAQAQEAVPPGGEAAAAAAAEGTDTEEPAETGAVEPEPARPATSYDPSGAFTPNTSAPIDPQTRLPLSPYASPGGYAPPPTSFNPSGAYIPAPAYERPVFPELKDPVFIDQLGRSPEAAPTYADNAYEARLRASFLSAQGMKGPLEGGWTLSAASGDQLYHLQLVDSASGLVEGAWRDLRRPGAIDASGLITGAQRIGSQLNLRIYPQGSPGPVTATLNATADGRWSGELIEGGQRRNVVLRRQ